MPTRIKSVVFVLLALAVLVLATAAGYYLVENVNVQKTIANKTSLPVRTEFDACFETCKSPNSDWDYSCVSLCSQGYNRTN